VRTAERLERKRRSPDDEAESTGPRQEWFRRWWRAPVTATLAIMGAAAFAVGGAHPHTQVVLAASVLALVVLNGIASGGVRRMPFTSVALFAVAWSCLQLVPFPSALVRIVSPQAFELRREVSSSVPSFMSLSLDLPATLLEICKGLMCAGVLLVVGRTATRERRARSLLIGISALGVSLAVIAGVQRAIHTDTILGFYQVRSLPGSFVFGTFVNSNHAASVLTLAALVSIGFAFETIDWQRMLSIAAATVSGVALFFTGSRGGAISFIGAGFLLMLVLLSRRHGIKRGALLAILLAAGVSLAVLVFADGLRDRLMPADTNRLWDNQKTRGWGAALRLLHDYLWTGVGRGAFEAPAAAFRADNEAVRLVFPENLVLQLLTECGILATLVMAAMFLFPAARLVPRLRRQEPSVVAAGCGVLAVLLHDLVDFGLEMPGVALPTIVALGVMVGRAPAGRSANGGGKFSRLSVPVLAAAGSIWIAALGAGWWAAGHTITVDGVRARDAVTQKLPSARAVVDDTRRRHPADYYFELIAAIQEMHAGTPGVLHHLNRALRLNPSNGDTHALAARWLARLGRRPQAALEFRLAREHGVATEFDEIFAAIGPAVVDAVPQQPELLLSLSQHLSARGHAEAADAVARRAVERSDSSEDALSNMIDIASSTGEPTRMIRVARHVLAANPGSAGVVAAARALFRAGEKTAANKALDAALIRIPDDPALLLAAARLRFEFGDPLGARDLLALHAEAQRSFHLADMVNLQQLLAEIAEKMGDANAGILARARGRMFSQRLSESQPAPGAGGEAAPAPR
jgi:O-antigen ligase/tetratricopeptide (TPR) repeat protein